MARSDRTLKAVFAESIPANLKWSAIENLLGGLGAEMTEGTGSRLRVKLNGIKAVLHRPHPSPEATRPQVKAVRQFLENAGVKP